MGPRHPPAAKLLPDDDLLGRIDAVNLKHVLGDIQTDCGNPHVDGSLCESYGDSSPGAGAIHHVKSELIPSKL
jgi:hypothetical protein